MTSAVQNLDLRSKSKTFNSDENLSCARLLREVLGVEVEAPDYTTIWKRFALFNSAVHCVAVLETATFPLMLDGTKSHAGALRSVAVDPAWRGRGLFRHLMTEALAWHDAGPGGPMLLYTEEPDLYHRFGFHPLTQHAFVGAAPLPRSALAARRLDLRRDDDRSLVRSLVARRTPVSSQVALAVDPDLILAHLLGDEGWCCAHLAEPEAVVVYETAPDAFVLADVIGPVVPDLASIIGAVVPGAERAKVLFPPDRLGWRGAPVVEDAGLMIRGDTPAAMTRPFMLPPTAEF